MNEFRSRANFSESLLRQLERQLAEHGITSLERSRSSLERQLAEHLEKLEEIRGIGGYTSSVEREIRNFQQQIRAIDDILRSYHEQSTSS